MVPVFIGQPEHYSPSSPMSIEEKIKGVVYKVECSCGSTYIGETGRTLEIRLKEHKRAVEKGDNKNGIAVHANKFPSHIIQWNTCTVLEQEQNWYKRRVKEALMIQKEKRTMNLDNGLSLSPIRCTL